MKNCLDVIGLSRVTRKSVAFIFYSGWTYPNSSVFQWEENLPHRHLCQVSYRSCRPCFFSPLSCFILFWYIFVPFSLVFVLLGFPLLSVFGHFGVKVHCHDSGITSLHRALLCLSQQLSTSALRKCRQYPGLQKMFEWPKAGTQILHSLRTVPETSSLHSHWHSSVAYGTKQLYSKQLQSSNWYHGCDKESMHSIVDSTL